MKRTKSFGTSLGDVMATARVRNDGRRPDELRPVSYEMDAFGFADASVLLKIGNTAVLSSVTMSAGSPTFARTSKKGWLTAEYAMLPMATRQRTSRESSSYKRNYRAIEISRLIGRVLRASVDLSAINDRSIIIDCDVLQADGGTRVTAITAASMALAVAQRRWLKYGIIKKGFIKERIVAVAVGLVAGDVYVDLNQEEDSSCDLDLNFVLNEHGGIIEIQGTAEAGAVSWDRFDEIRDAAVAAAKDLISKTEVGDTKGVPHRIEEAILARWRGMSL